VDEPRPEQRMLEVSARLLERRDRVAPRHLASSEPFELRKNEPHPMGGFASGAQLLARLLERPALSFDEPLQTEGIVHTAMLANGVVLLRYNPFWKVDEHRHARGDTRMLRR